jgi:hypothetical protein
MWLGTSSIKGLLSPDTVTHLSAIVGDLSHSGGGSGSAASYSHTYTRQGPQIVHLASACYYTHTTHTTRKTHRLCTYGSYTSLSSYYYLCHRYYTSLSSYYYVFVRILSYICPHRLVLLRLLWLLRCHDTNTMYTSSISRGPHTGIYRAVSYYFACVVRHISQSHKLNMCPDTTRYLMASCCCICQWGRRVRVRGTGRARCSTGSSRSHPVLARDAGRARCFAGSSSSHPVLACDAEWVAVGVREIGKALRRLPAFNGDFLCSDRRVTDSFVQTARRDGGTFDQCLRQRRSLWQQETKRDRRPHLCSVPTWELQGWSR